MDIDIALFSVLFLVIPICSLLALLKSRLQQKLFFLDYLKFPLLQIIL